MRRVLVVIHNEIDRDQVKRVADTCPFGTRFEIKEQRRSLEQNAKMWALLTDISRHVLWHGMQLPPSDWKLIFLDALKHEMRVVPNLAGTGFVNLGTSSSDLSKAEMSDLIELIYAFGIAKDVPFREVNYGNEATACEQPAHARDPGAVVAKYEETR